MASYTIFQDSAQRVRTIVDSVEIVDSVHIVDTVDSVDIIDSVDLVGIVDSVDIVHNYNIGTVDLYGMVYIIYRYLVYYLVYFVRVMDNVLSPMVSLFSYIHNYNIDRFKVGQKKYDANRNLEIYG